MPGARALGGQRQFAAGVHPGYQAGRAEQHQAGVVGDLQRGGGHARRRARIGEQHGSSWGAETLDHLVQLAADQPVQDARIVEDLGQFGDPLDQVVALGFELDAAQPGEASQLQVEDVVGLGLRELEGLDQPVPGLGGIVGGADDRDHVVDVEHRQQQALDQVQPLVGLAQLVLGAPGGDLEAVFQVDLQHLLEPERAGLTVDQRDRVDREGVLKLGQLVELLEQGIGVDAVLDLDHQAGAMGEVGEVLDVGDAGDLLALDGVLDLLDDALGAGAVGQFGDHDAAPARADLVDAGGGAQLEGAAATRVGVLDAIEADDLAAGGHVGAGDEAHQRVQVGLGVGQ